MIDGSFFVVVLVSGIVCTYLMMPMLGPRVGEGGTGIPRHACYITPCKPQPEFVSCPRRRWCTLTLSVNDGDSLVERRDEHVESKVELVAVQQQRVSNVPLQHHLAPARRYAHQTNAFACHEKK